MSFMMEDCQQKQTHKQKTTKKNHITLKQKAFHIIPSSELQKSRVRCPGYTPSHTVTYMSSSKYLM